MDSRFELLPATKRIEEETVINYNAAQYYPVQIGDVFHSRYRVLAKLGFGKVLRWLPEERPSAGELLAQDDEFLTQFMTEMETGGI
jgi:hypothetical protein